jgi:hypothetical protein
VKAVVIGWALAGLAIAVGLWLASARIGRARAAAALVVLGVVMLSLEEPALSLWLALADAGVDRDGIAARVTPMARAHVLDAAVFSLGLAALLARIAVTSFRRGERWAARVLAAALAVAVAAEVATTVLVSSRGLPLPPPADRGAGFGWQPVAVALAAWSAGLVLRRRARGEVAPP